MVRGGGLSSASGVRQRAAATAAAAAEALCCDAPAQLDLPAPLSLSAACASCLRPWHASPAATTSACEAGAWAGSGCRHLLPAALLCTAYLWRHAAAAAARTSGSMQRQREQRSYCYRIELLVPPLNSQELHPAVGAAQGGLPRVQVKGGCRVGLHEACVKWRPSPEAGGSFFWQQGCWFKVSVHRYGRMCRCCIERVAATQQPIFHAASTLPDEFVFAGWPARHV